MIPALMENETLARVTCLLRITEPITTKPQLKGGYKDNNDFCCPLVTLSAVNASSGGNSLG